VLICLHFCILTNGAAATVSFRNDVEPVLSKAGCNAGICHGNKNGKGGFKLSLRGEDPELDYASIVRDLAARRVNPSAPGESLLLLKPTAAVPHEGGQRFAPGSLEWNVLYGWISQRCLDDRTTAPRLVRLAVDPQEQILVAPSRSQQLHVKAEFDSGMAHDVSELAVYDPVNQIATVSHGGFVEAKSEGETTVLVRFLNFHVPVHLAFVPNRAVPAFPRSANYIDDEVFAKLRTLRIASSPSCSDRFFLRRAYLDLLGLLPTPAEARAFVSDANPRKREKLVDRLLDRPEFADFWALKWCDLLRVEAHSLDEKGVQAFHHWVRESILSHKPVDQFVRELILARGSTYANPAANYYRPNRNAASRAKAAAQVFLGARIQCAECHNHPSDRWTQNDYYDWATLFSRINYKVIQNNREISSDEHEWKGEQIVYVANKGSLTNPRTGNAAQPRLLGVSQPVDQTDLLQGLASWLTSPTNQLFAAVQANRIWYHLMGRGLVDPPDDFRASNPASHPRLLERLTADFVEHHFDLRHLIRVIMNSKTYQLSSQANETNASDELDYSHNLLRRLGAEQLLDSQSEVTEAPLKFGGFPPGIRASQLPGVRPESKGKRRAFNSDQFLEFFGKPPRLLATDSERSCECNMTQAFQMISGPTVLALVSDPQNCVSRLLQSGMPADALLDELFWKALTRPPTQSEAAILLPQLAKAKEPRRELEDIVWGLLNSQEFLFRQ